MEYVVKYEIEIDADSPKEAALMVAKILKEDSMAGVYTVREFGSPLPEVYIDLLEEE